MDGARVGEIGFLGLFNGAINGQSAVVIFGECRGAAGVGGALRWLSRAQHVIAPLPGPASTFKGYHFSSHNPAILLRLRLPSRHSLVTPISLYHRSPSTFSQVFEVLLINVAFASH